MSKNFSRTFFNRIFYSTKEKKYSRPRVKESIWVRVRHYRRKTDTFLFAIFSGCYGIFDFWRRNSPVIPRFNRNFLLWLPNNTLYMFKLFVNFICGFILRMKQSYIGVSITNKIVLFFNLWIIKYLFCRFRCFRVKA